MEKSTHKCEVIRVVDIIPHDNADNLEIVKLFDGGYQTVVQKGNFSIGSMGVFIPPDSLVDTNRPEFSFLSNRVKNHNSMVRIHACRFRGAMSYGLLIPLTTDNNIGDDLATLLGVEHYEPELAPGNNKDSIGAPPGIWHKYDIDSLRRYNKVFEDRELVCCSEKIHGENSRAVFIDDNFYVGSHSQWKKYDPIKSLFWRAVIANPGIEKFCRDNPGYAVYGEEYGKIKGFNYGLTKDLVSFACFDIRKPDTTYIDTEKWLELCNQYTIPTVPIINSRYEFNLEQALTFAEGHSLMPGADHIREGVVIKSYTERYNVEIGRKILKIVGFGYLQKK